MKRKEKKKNILQNKVVAIFIIALLLVGFGFFVIKMVENIFPEKESLVRLETTHGDIVIKLYSDMPITSGNFEKLVNEEFYDGVIFHRVIKDFMIQGGDPTGTGSGGPGYNIEDEFVSGRSNIRGTIAMANTGKPNSGGSQFFINLVDNTFLDFDKQPLTSKHPVFGEVIEGMDIVDLIGSVKVGAGSRPVEEVKIIRASVV